MQTWNSTATSCLLTWIMIAQALECFSDVLFVVFFFSRSPVGVLHVDNQKELLALDTEILFCKKKNPN